MSKTMLTLNFYKTDTISPQIVPYSAISNMQPQYYFVLCN